MFVTATFKPKGKGEVSIRKSHKGITGGAYYASQVVFDNKAALWNNVDYSKKQKTLDVIDLKNGKKLFSKKLTARGWAYASPTYAGGFLYVAGDAGACHVLFPHTGASGFEMKEVACNQLEPFRSCPVFEGERLYIRTLKGLWCFQASDEDMALAKQLKGK